MNEILFPILSLGGLGLVFGVLLGYASKKFAVKVDPKVPLIRDCLPGANCGGCGFAGCDAYAQAVAEGTAKPNCCSVGGSEVAGKVAEIMGASVEDSEPLKAFVKCNGDCEKAKKRGNYYGDIDCQEASVLPGAGDKACSYGCLGYGSCVKACQFDAIHVKDGIAQVDPEKCVGCGACVKACPRSIIELKPLSSVVRVACNSKDTLKAVKDVCSVGCISCKLCERNCPKEAISFENNLPVVDKEKCVKCLICVKKCPTGALIAYGKDIKVKKAE
ncbi:Fe-S cluster domain-containing protein [Clostridium niameyense]|uniref:Ion-translocating oxidoreductase complex subunit B n=1 Tax=Clostridium niameyense TaxID=1622073 RepID=A0A6M0RAE0_9CLOT|nr:Fe-S cluster domain-containing protein [Clostridium niameyense]NEZ47176.1 Fe-S cluster domain-containing protein [Clostridium niameyense]